MDTNLATAIVTGGFTSLVSVSALILSSKRTDDLRDDLKSLKADIKDLRVAVDLLTGYIKDLDKRVSIIEDRLKINPV